MHNIKQVIAVRKDLNMRKGKLAAQVAHASMAFLTHLGQIEPTSSGAELTTLLNSAEAEWIKMLHTKIVVSVDDETQLLELIKRAGDLDILCCDVVDKGFTEFNGKETLTCAAFGPDYASKLDTLTGNLKLL